jgi:hypothetical protein
MDGFLSKQNLRNLVQEATYQESHPQGDKFKLNRCTQQ